MKLLIAIVVSVAINEIRYATGRTTGQSVQIAIQEKGALKIDRDALKKLLLNPEIQNKPLAVISIAGAKRTGKSFLMNFFLRYLRNQESLSWLGGPDKVLDDGFKWAAGHRPNTTGINIWDEYLTLKKKNGEEVVVLLMDTQGLYDHDTSKETNVKLFTFSTLASSVQILNIMNMVEERDLENLHLCVEFAIAASRGKSGAMQLQNLLMLVRNWPHIKSHQYGLRGGHNYLKEVLLEKSELPENNNVRKYLLSAFSEVECYLMPHPGLTVTQGDFHGTNKEISPDSLMHTEEFVEHILSPENIVVKNWQGNPITAEELLALILNCDDAFESGKLPKVENMLEANMNAHYSIANVRSLRKYKECMDDICNREIPVSSEDLVSEDERCARESMNAYDSTIYIGSDKVRSNFREQLNEELLKESRMCKDSFKIRMNEIKKEIREAMENLFQEYRKTMDEYIEGPTLPVEKLLTYHSDQYEKKLLEFKFKVEKYQDIMDLDVLYSKFKMVFDDYYASMEKINFLKLQIEKEEGDRKELLAQIEELQNRRTNFFEDLFEIIGSAFRLVSTVGGKVKELF